jgi:hypothetical protein
VANGLPVEWLKNKAPQHFVTLSGWIRDQNDAGTEFVAITPDVLRRVSQMRLPGLRDRAARALVAIATKYPSVESSWTLRGLAEDLELQARSYSADAASAWVVMCLLIEEGYLRNHGGGGGISVRGLLEVESLERATSDSAQGFVAMSFHDNLRDAWINGFDPAIRAVGFNPLRLDNKDHVGGISDQIIAEIRHSRFAIADYTDQINGVYFEAGFALGLGLTVIPTCQADQFDNLHFDIRHLNTLKWHEPSDLAENLARRIRAIIGTGPFYMETER